MKRKLFCVLEVEESNDDPSLELYALDLITTLRQSAAGTLSFLSEVDVYCDLQDLLNEHLLPGALAGGDTP